MDSCIYKSRKTRKNKRIDEKDEDGEVDKDTIVSLGFPPGMMRLEGQGLLDGSVVLRPATPSGTLFTGSVLKTFPTFHHVCRSTFRVPFKIDNLVMFLFAPPCANHLVLPTGVNLGSESI